MQSIEFRKGDKGKRGKRRGERMTRVNQYIQEILNGMEEREFTQGEAEMLPKMLERSIKENSKRFEHHKPFTVFKFPTDCSGQ